MSVGRGGGGVGAASRGGVEAGLLGSLMGRSVEGEAISLRRV